MSFVMDFKPPVKSIYILGTTLSEQRKLTSFSTKEPNPLHSTV